MSSPQERQIARQANEKLWEEFRIEVNTVRNMRKTTNPHDSMHLNELSRFTNCLGHDGLKGFWSW